MAAIPATFFNETQVLFTENIRLLLKYYERPANLKQCWIFAREALKMDNFRKGIKNRLQYAFAVGTLDLPMRFALFRQINSGWHATFGTTEINFLRKIPPTLVVAAATSWLGVPLEMARMAYYADKTFPKELQRGYKSYFHALRRIPFEEGPYYLFKNTFPFVMRNFLHTFTLLFTYDFVIDKLGTVTFRQSHNWPYDFTKFLAITLSCYLSCVFSYPWAVTIREMVDFWPKEKGGVCTFQNNYRKAAVWLWYHDYGSNYFPGFVNNYFWRNAPWMFVSLWIADTMGMFKYWRIDPYSGPGTNTWEDVFA